MLRLLRVSRAARGAAQSVLRTELRTGALSYRKPLGTRNYSDDLLTIDLNDTNADTKGFFNFQTGRWLQNDLVEREARTTKFSLPGLLELLKEKCDYLEKTPEQSALAIETIEPLFEGKHNKLYKIKLKDMRQYVLRIPYAIGHQAYREHRLLSEVATMDFLQTQSGVKLPTPVAWGKDTNNPLESAFILMDYVEGEKLMAQWKPWSNDLKEKSAVVKPVVDLQDKILSTEFEAIGSLYYAEDMPSGVRATANPEHAKWVIGPSTEKRFWKGRTPDVGAEFRGPWTSHQDYLQATAKVQRAYAEDWLAQDPSNELLQKAKLAAERYQRLVPSLFLTDEFAQEVYSNRLHHPDLSPLNVLSQDDFTKFWLIDFENTAVRPFLLHGVPWFVRNRGERIYKQEEVPDYDKLGEMDKMIVDHYIRLTQTEFAYEFLFHKARPQLFQALNPGIKRREEVVDRAMAVDINTGFYNDLDYSIYKLTLNWPFLNLNPERDCPVKFDQAEVDTLSEDNQKWNMHLTRNPVLESKGFIGATQFDQYLGEGSLVPKGDGSYEFTKEFLDKSGPAA